MSIRFGAVGAAALLLASVTISGCAGTIGSGTYPSPRGGESSIYNTNPVDSSDAICFASVKEIRVRSASTTTPYRVRVGQLRSNNRDVVPNTGFGFEQSFLGRGVWRRGTQTDRVRNNPDFTTQAGRYVGVAVYDETGVIGTNTLYQMPYDCQGKKIQFTAYVDVTITRNGEVRITNQASLLR